MKEKMIENLTKTALFAALVFIGTFTFKIPVPFGYMHLGDCMIFLAVLILGGKKGAIAGAIGAGLADLISGYAVWFIPTIICKSLMAFIMGYLISERFFGLKGKALWLSGAVCGGIFQTIGYTVTRIFFYGMAAALSAIPLLFIQTGLGILFTLIISESLKKTSLKKVFLHREDTKEVTQSC